MLVTGPEFTSLDGVSTLATGFVRVSFGDTTGIVFVGIPGTAKDGLALNAVTSEVCAARRADLHAKTRRAVNQLPAKSATMTRAEIIQAARGIPDVTAGGLPVQTGTLGRSPTAITYSATMSSSSSPR